MLHLVENPNDVALSLEEFAVKARDADAMVGLNSQGLMDLWIPARIPTYDQWPIREAFEAHKTTLRVFVEAYGALRWRVVPKLKESASAMEWLAYEVASRKMVLQLRDDGDGGCSVFVSGEGDIVYQVVDENRETVAAILLPIARLWCYVHERGALPPSL